MERRPCTDCSRPPVPLARGNGSAQVTRAQATAAAARILVADDELSMREFLEIMLTREGYTVSCAADATSAVALLKREEFDLVMTDIRMPGGGGLEVLRRVKETSPDTVVIMISAYTSTETAVEAMKQGAYDYISKPFNVDEVRLIIRNALERRVLERENLRLKRELKESYEFGNIIGASPQIQRVYDVIRRAAPTETSVLITGESGTGKELVARALHGGSGRRDKPFVTVNCAGIPESLIESELFGHRKGAFTGAVASKMGMFQEAHGGTIFLDEIGDLPLSLQAKLLRVVQERTFRPVGAGEDASVDVRIVSATNKDLEREVIHDRFREDLFYRLNVIHIHLPPLRERREDIPLLAAHFLEKYAHKQGKDISCLSNFALDMLAEYDFPGNVRELENMIERSVALESSRIVMPESLALSSHRKRERKEDGGVAAAELAHDDALGEGFCLDGLIERLERRLIGRALEQAAGSKHKAAELLGITLRSFRYRLDKYGLEGSDPDNAG
ncbi:MAG: sigma-54 dependent transcriptional regulator [Pseudomonadota bacterium]